MLNDRVMRISPGNHLSSSSRDGNKSLTDYHVAHQETGRLTDWLLIRLADIWIGLRTKLTDWISQPTVTHGRTNKRTNNKWMNKGSKMQWMKDRLTERRKTDRAFVFVYCVTFVTRSLLTAGVTTFYCLDFVYIFSSSRSPSPPSACFQWSMEMTCSTHTLIWRLELLILYGSSAKSIYTSSSRSSYMLCSVYSLVLLEIHTKDSRFVMFPTPVFFFFVCRKNYSVTTIRSRIETLMW